jgi:hypothetical protein
MFGEALKKRIDRRPFEPFVMHITGGEKVKIRHPELAFLTRTSIVVGHGVHDGIADYALDYSLIHVVKLEPLTTRVEARDGNGHAKSKPKK